MNQEKPNKGFVELFVNITGGHLKSGQHFKATFLPYYATQKNGSDTILNLIQNTIDLSNITAIIVNERELSNNMWTFASSHVRQIIDIFTKRSRVSLVFVGESYFTCLLWAQILGNAGYYVDLPLMHVKKQIQAENEAYEESHGPAHHF